MLTTPREKKKVEKAEDSNEENQAKATTVVVEGIVNEIYKEVDNVIAAENLDNVVEHIVKDLEKESDKDVKPQGIKEPRVDKSTVKITNKEKIETIKALPSARQEEFRTYTQNQAGKRQSKTKKTSVGNKSKKISNVNGADQRKPEKNPRL